MTSPNLDAGQVICVVVTYNSARYLAKCLNAAISSGIGQVVVWDNASTDTSAEISSEILGGANVIRSEENVGYGRAINAVVARLGRNRPVLALNPDCFLTTEIVTSMLDLLSADPNCGIVVPAMVYPDGTRAIAGGAFPTLTKEVLAWLRIDRMVPRSLHARAAHLGKRLPLFRSLFMYLDSRDSAKVMYLDWASGYCMLLRPEVWAAVGGFDERFFLYFEDVAICHRAHDAGWSVGCDGRVRAVHDESASTRFAAKGALYRRGMWLYFRNYGTPLQRKLGRLAPAR